MSSAGHLNFKGNDPGASRHGNFINYYQFHSPSTRIELLPTDVWGTSEEIVCLDIGCNAGDLTLALHEFFIKKLNKKCHILGIDIDPILIKRAEEKNSDDSICFKTLDFMNINERTEILNGYLNNFNRTTFDIVFCFSITMWIHLNNGDEGLNRFITTLCKISNIIIIEPQPWKCYRAAVKRMKKSKDEFSNYSKLKIRNNVETVLEDLIMKNCKNFIKTTDIFEEKWGRKLQIFRAAYQEVLFFKPLPSIFLQCKHLKAEHHHKLSSFDNLFLEF